MSESPRIETVVEESERQPFGVGLDPQCQLGQLHRQRILVNAVETMNGDEAAAERLGFFLGEPRFLPFRGPAWEVADQLVVGIGEYLDTPAIFVRLGERCLVLCICVCLLSTPFGRQGSLIAEPACL